MRVNDNKVCVHDAKKKKQNKKQRDKVRVTNEQTNINEARKQKHTMQHTHTHTKYNNLRSSGGVATQLNDKASVLHHTT